MSSVGLTASEYKEMITSLQYPGQGTISGILDALIDRRLHDGDVFVSAIKFQTNQLPSLKILTFLMMPEKVLPQRLICTLTRGDHTCFLLAYSSHPQLIFHVDHYTSPKRGGKDGKRICAECERLGPQILKAWTRLAPHVQVMNK